ncbi:hypothetical protein ACPW7J_09655 [Ihubacter sp. rT4E-8]|uniref:hypothetical protein n=1 Tax=Ihubacter sp. rT4E-8 TaxID=3242369 RepID=UPI003CF259AD
MEEDLKRIEEIKKRHDSEIESWREYGYGIGYRKGYRDGKQSVFSTISALTSIISIVILGIVICTKIFM